MILYLNVNNVALITLLLPFQFFMSNRSVYILVWNVRLGHEHAGLDFWLHSIACHAPDTPVFVVGTHIDEVGCFKIYFGYHQQPQYKDICLLGLVILTEYLKVTLYLCIANNKLTDVLLSTK